MVKVQRKTKRCPEYQVNVRVPDYLCSQKEGHGGSPHYDPATGTRWNHGDTPRGMKKKRGKNNG